MSTLGNLCASPLGFADTSPLGFWGCSGGTVWVGCTEWDQRGNPQGGPDVDLDYSMGLRTFSATLEPVTDYWSGLALDGVAGSTVVRYPEVWVESIYRGWDGGIYQGAHRVPPSNAPTQTYPPVRRITEPSWGDNVNENPAATNRYELYAINPNGGAFTRTVNGLWHLIDGDGDVTTDSFALDWWFNATGEDLSGSGNNFIFASGGVSALPGVDRGVCDHNGTAYVISPLRRSSVVGGQTLTSLDLTIMTTAAPYVGGTLEPGFADYEFDVDTQQESFEYIDWYTQAAAWSPDGSAIYAHVIRDHATRIDTSGSASTGTRTADAYLYVIDPATATATAKHSLGNRIDTSNPQGFVIRTEIDVDADGNVYLLEDGRYLNKYNSDIVLQWTVDLGLAFFSSGYRQPGHVQFSCDDDGGLYIPLGHSGGGSVLARLLTEDGSLDVATAPLVAANGDPINAYTVCFDGAVDHRVCYVPPPPS